MKNSFLFKSFKNTKLNIIIIIVSCIISSYLASLIPLYIKYAIDEVFYKNKANIPEFLTRLFYLKNIKEKLLIICIILLIINLMLSIVNYIKNKYTAKFNVKINNNVKKQILNKTANLKYDSFKKYNNSEILQRVDIDSNTYTTFFDTGLIMLLEVFFTTAFSIYNAFKLNTPIALYATSCIIIMIVASIIYFNKIKFLVDKKVSNNENVIKYLNNYIKNIKMIKMYGKENENHEKIIKYIDKYKNASYKVSASTNKYNGICHLLNITRDAVVVTIGGAFVALGKLSLGSLTALFTYVAKTIEGARQFTSKFNYIGEVYVSYKRLSKYLNMTEDEPKIIDSLSGDILFDNVTIYVNELPILSNLNFKIRENQKYVIVGDTGCGKTILLKTLLRLYKYTGNIYIGKTNINELNINDIITNIAYLDDKDYLFNTTIAENICLNNSDIYLTEYAKKVCIYDEIINFEHQFNTVINENTNLSGGQKERIALARALYKKNKTYLFDDCLKRLDSNTKMNVLNNLLKENFTFVMATLDYNIIKQVKNVLFIHNNTITQDTHEKLYKTNEYYKQLINIDRNTLGEEYE